MKDSNEILAEAPKAPGVGTALAYYCTNCPWWTNRPDACLKPEGPGRLMCPQALCGTPLKVTDLEFHLNVHRNGLPPEDYARFLASFSDNWSEK